MDNSVETREHYLVFTLLHVKLILGRNHIIKPCLNSLSSFPFCSWSMRLGLLLYRPSTQTGWNWLWRSSARPSREWPMPTARTWTRISLVSCGCAWLFILWKQHAVPSSSTFSSPSGNASQRVVAMQPETKAMMDLILEKDFTLSVALDGGFLVATYPYDKPVQSGNDSQLMSKTGLCWNQ